ncbi:hypothetical protein SCOR_16015 [Sulfidibacter corallicola]|uniref:Uncharacterized protein n=1 Tax=Sulfidibacter corallicola TaxID=2818388 RepID=A0A8A4TXU9_SULCO|nr:hypothetical protein [Sulfidibacter corallicola]QTD54028.1 hypothetical protein J3U87_16400 [Sulfidibacter corallicola]
MWFAKHFLTGLLLAGLGLHAQSWYLQEANKINYDIKVDLAGVDFSKSKRDEFRTGTWLQNSAVSDLKSRMRDQLRRRIPYEFDPARSDLSYVVKVSCNLVETKTGLKFDDLTVGLDVNFDNQLFQTFKAKKEVERVRTLQEVSQGNGTTLDDFKFLIVNNAQKLITKVDHLELSASKDKITVPGVAFSETLVPGEIGTSELYLGNDQLLIYLNGKKILDHQKSEVAIEAFKSPLLGSDPLVKLKSGAAPTFYFKFIDQVGLDEARRRCELIRGFISNR